MKVGYLRCAACGAVTNCVELSAGPSPPCKDERARDLSLLHRRYDRAILAGDLSAASLAADEVEGYERVWGLRLLAAPSVAQMRRAIAGASEGDAYGA